MIVVDVRFLRHIAKDIARNAAESRRRESSGPMRPEEKGPVNATAMAMNGLVTTTAVTNRFSKYNTDEGRDQHDLGLFCLFGWTTFQNSCMVEYYGYRIGNVKVERKEFSFCKN